MKDKILLKILDSAGFSPYALCHWNLPRRDKPGKWMPLLRGKMIKCKYGYHLLKPLDFIEWICNTGGERGTGAVYLAEAGRVGSIGRKDGGDKVVVRRARLIRRLNWGRDEADLLLERMIDASPTHAPCGGEYTLLREYYVRANKLQFSQSRMYSHHKELELREIIMEVLGI